MKWLHVIVKNLLRNKRRTLLSVGWAESYYVAILVDPESYRQVFSGMARSIPASEYQHFLQNRNGVLVGQKIMEEYGWQVGDAVKLRSLQHKVELNLVISGVLKKSGGQLQQQETQMLINWNYYEMLIGNPGKVNIFWLRVDRPENAMSVGTATMT